MDNLTPDELEAHRRALEMLSANPGMQSISTPKESIGEGEQPMQVIEHPPAKEPVDPKADPYANQPYAPASIKRLFPDGPPLADPTGGGGLVMGEARAVAPVARKAIGEALDMSRIKQLLTGGSEEAPRVFGDSAKTAARRQAANETADMAETGLTGAKDVQKTTEQMNREIAMQERNKEQLARIKATMRKGK